jgi:uncharacterized membrane protein
MMGGNQAFERAMKLAAVSGLRSMLGPALVAAAQDGPAKAGLAVAAMGEMVADKMPGMPSRSSLLGLIPRALAGAWVAKTVLEHEGEHDPYAAAKGAGVAVAVALCAPMVRAGLRTILGVPDAVIGLAEDGLALKLGTEAAGLSLDDLRQVAEQSIGEVKERVSSGVQSIGAGSM